MGSRIDVPLVVQKRLGDVAVRATFQRQLTSVSQSSSVTQTERLTCGISRSGYANRGRCRLHAKLGGLSEMTFAETSALSCVKESKSPFRVRPCLEIANQGW